MVMQTGPDSKNPNKRPEEIFDCKLRLVNGPRAGDAVVLCYRSNPTYEPKKRS